ncbi:MAG TPA: hypothetical protein VF411_14165 [Bacteroidia bacterium]
MDFLKKNIFLVLLVVGGVFISPVFSQNFGETSEHKKVWRLFGRKKHRDAYNPYVKNGKSTHEPSKKQAKEDKALIKKQKKEAKKEWRKNKHKLGLK